jgi:hypothetical protein
VPAQGQPAARPSALTEAARLRGPDPGGVVVDLEDYARIAKIAGR